MAGKSASLTFRLVLRATQPITMSNKVENTKRSARLFDFDGFWLIVLAVSRKKKYNKRIYENMVDLLVWHNKE